MINLIKNELIKIFKKKSIYITLAIALIFIVIINIIYNNESNFTWNNIEEQLKSCEEELKYIDKDDITQIEWYANVITRIEELKLIQQYGDMETWQAQIIQSKVDPIINQMNYYKYVEKNNEGYTELKKEYDDIVKKINSGDWKYFAKEDLKYVDEQLKMQNELKNITKSQQQLKLIEQEIANAEISKQIINWRIEKNIPYGNDYKNICLNNYGNSKNNIAIYENSNDKDEYQFKTEYYYNLKLAAISKYDIENETSTGDGSGARGALLNVYEEFEIFIIIITIMIAGSIVSEEFNKGTIKLLLIKPYKRTTILMSKFITAILILILVILLIILMQYLIGGIMQGFDTYSVPVTEYNYNTNQIQLLNPIVYVILQGLGKMPIYILLLTLTFALSTIFTNSALAITIGVLGYMGSPIINEIGLVYKLKWLKFFVTPNWDLTQYFFGGLPTFEGLTPIFSSIIIIIYMLIMIATALIIFKKKNIKNI